MPSTGGWGVSQELGRSGSDGVTVSVVIPTRHRPELVVRAVLSALQQSLPPHEVVVVVDGPDSDTVSAVNGLGDRRVVVVELAVNGGAARARNIGVRNSTGQWVAFLDDDDQWHPEKLQRQLTRASASSIDADSLVLATRVERAGDSPSDWWPLRSPEPNESVTDYLFVRRQPGEGFLQTSTLMLTRVLAAACPFPEHLRHHEDYDWFIELEKRGARFEVVLEPLVTFHAPGARASLSSNVRWETSLSWILSRKGDVSKRAFRDFCLTELAHIARSTGGVRAKAAIFLLASETGLSWFSTSRFLAICFLPSGVRRSISARLGSNSD